MLGSALWVALLVVLLTKSCAIGFFFSGATQEAAKEENDDQSSIATLTRIGQCEGLMIDHSRLITVSDEDINVFVSSSRSRERYYHIINQRPVHPTKGKPSQSRLASSSKKGMFANIRLQASTNNINIHGSHVVVTTLWNPECQGKSQNNTTRSSRGPEECINNNQSATKIQGKMFSNIAIPTSEPHTMEEAKLAIANHFDAPMKNVAKELLFEIYPTASGDFLAYFGNVLARKSLYEVVLDAVELTIIRTCLVAGSTIPRSSTFQHQPRQLQVPKIRGNRVIQQSDQTDSPSNHQPKANRLLQEQKGKNGDTTALCSNNTCNASTAKNVNWFNNEEMAICPLQSLYLNNSGKSTACIQGLAGNGEYVFGPGPVPDLYWDGVFDCQNNVDPAFCDMAPFPPIACHDAASDVQFAALETLKFLRDHLGFVGGQTYHQANQAAKAIKALVRYDKDFCNAFYRRIDDIIFFGDCDCQIGGPMVSVDIVAHEISHYLTWHTSRLAYGYESGGLSEGFGDILGTIMEWIINDTKDTPDFLVGETTGPLVRDMWKKTGNGTVEELDNVCQFDVRTSTSVHGTSRPLNKAFVASVETCQKIGCATSTKECVILMGSIFLYSNMHKLSMYSGYLDAAAASCESVDEFYIEHHPDTSCSVENARSSLKEGWKIVNIEFDQNDNPCKPRKDCEGVSTQTLATRTFLAFAGFLNRIVKVKENVFFAR